MRITPKFNVKRFQMGGEMAPAEEMPMDEGAEMGAPMEEGAPMEGGEQQDPMMMLIQAAAQALQGQDCQMAMLVCQALMQLAQQMQGGGAPEGPQSEPVFRRGGILVRRK